MTIDVLMAASFSVVFHFVRFLKENWSLESGQSANLSTRGHWDDEEEQWEVKATILIPKDDEIWSRNTVKQLGSSQEKSRSESIRVNSALW